VVVSSRGSFSDLHATTQAFAGGLIIFFILLLMVAFVSRDRLLLARSAQPTPIRTGLKINPNTDDASTLMLLPGVGPGIAVRIEDARRQGEVFTQAEDLETVKQIGPKLAAKVEPWVVFE